MPKRPVARILDFGSHGGVIVTGSSIVSANGRKIACVGDTYMCPEHGPNPIETGAPSVFAPNGLVAHVGSTTACGARIISGSPDVFVDVPDSFEENVITESSHGLRRIVNPKKLKLSYKELLEKIQKDIQLQKQMLQAWKESFKANENGTLLSEQGGWIVENPDGSLSLKRIPSTGEWASEENILSNNAQLSLSFHPSTKPSNTIGMFHTHPVVNEYNIQSIDDVMLSERLEMPGAIFTINPETGRKAIITYDNTSVGIE